MYTRLCLGLLAVIVSLAATPLLFLAEDPSLEPAKPKLFIAFASYRERPKQPKVYFYEHDGVANGKVLGSIDTANLRSDHRPSLSHDGRLCAFASELENQTGRILLWDVKDKKLIDLPGINDSPNALFTPGLSGDGKLLAFGAWNRPGGSQRWDLFCYDITAKKLIDLPYLNTAPYDERMPAFSGDGRFLAFTSNAKGGVGLTDIYLYDRRESKVLPLPELNSKHMDVEPSLSADGNLIAFVSDRPPSPLPSPSGGRGEGDRGGRDIYLFDRAAGKFLPLPGLNSVAHEQSPSLSPDGRYIAFVSERVGGEGERDLYLYDRVQQKLLPTPGLNSKAEDMDPCVIGVKQTNE